MLGRYLWVLVSFLFSIRIFYRGDRGGRREDKISRISDLRFARLCDLCGLRG